MPNYGLLGGVADSIREGFSGYTQIKAQEEAQKLKKQEFQAGLVEKGLIQTPEGQIQMDPNTMSQVALQRQMNDPKSDVSRRHREFARAIMEQTHEGSGDAISDEMTASDLKQFQPLFGKQITGQYGLEGRQATSNRIGESNDIKRQQLSERQNVNASHAGQAFENDKLIKQIKGTQNNLDRADSLLSGDVPITGKSFNVIQQDLANALAPGGAATEGKVNREMVETAASQLNNLQLRFGSVKDLRKEQPEIVKNLRELIGHIKGDYTSAMANQAADIHDSFANTSNPSVQKTIREKLKRYAPEEYKKRYESSPSAAAPSLKGPGGGLIETPASQTVPGFDPNSYLKGR